MEKVEIIEAAELFLAETGKEPSNREVLKKLGRGSLADITPVMKEWRDERKEREAKAVSMPEEMQNVAATLVNRLWIEANIIAQKSIVTAAATHEAEIERLQQTESDLLKELSDEQEENEHLSRELLALREKVKALEVHEKDCIRLQALLEASEADREKLRAEVAEQKAKNDDLLKSLSNLASASLNNAIKNS